MNNFLFQVDYLVAELPALLSGIERGGLQYTGFVYPTSLPALCKRGAFGNAMADLLFDIHTQAEFSELRRAIIGVSEGREVIPGGQKLLL